MKKKRKTYAVAGMMEYQTVVEIGRNVVPVLFSGGSISSGCSQPARYVTDSLIMQNAVEGCRDFRRGRIRLERTEVLAEELEIMGPRRVAKASGTQALSPAAVQKPDFGGGTCGDAKSEALTPGQTGASGEAEPEALTPGQTGASEASGLETVEVSCKDVAKQYLQDHFGENPAKLRTRDDVQKCAARYGIVFDFK